MDKHADGQTDIGTKNGKIDGQWDRRTEIWRADRQFNVHMDLDIELQLGGQIDKRTDKLT